MHTLALRWGMVFAVVVLAAVLPLAAVHGQAQDDSSNLVCTLSESQTERAIAAFGRLMPVFQNDRCANCHNKIDPFAARGHVDIREALSVLRDRGTLEHVRRDTMTSADEAHPALIRFLDGGTLTNSQRIAIMHANACSICHDPPAGTSNWRMAPVTDGFHDKDALKLCRHIHTNDLTNTPADFEKHMRDDEFIKVGFQGTRGLNGVGIAAFEESTRASYVPKPITSPTYGGMMGSVREWLEAQRRKFSKNADCGCRPFRYAFEYAAEWNAAINNRGTTMTSQANSRTKVPLVFADDGTFTGEGRMSWPVHMQMQSPGTSCTFDSESNMIFRLRGHVTETDKLRVEGVAEMSATPTQVSCQANGRPFAFSAPPAGPRSVPISFEIDARVGARNRKQHGSGNISITTDAILIEER